MSWHSFNVGSAYTTAFVTAVCEHYIASGRVKDKVEKRTRLQRIAECGQDYITFSPTGTRGWGASPLNENNWQTQSGVPIATRRTISRGNVVL